MSRNDFGKLIPNFLIVIVLVIITAMGQSQKKSIDPNIPIADYDAVLPNLNAANQQIRQAKNAFYHRDDSQPLRDPGPDSKSYPLPSISHLFVNLPPLPVKQSDAVIIGTITAAAAVLTEDKKSLYSEFTIQVERAFKTETLPVSPSLPLVAERFGGAVRFPSGVVWEYRHQDMNYPRIGARYVLFLKREGQVNLIIVTGYELLNGKVRPLDDAEVFKAYQDQSESDFIAALIGEIEKGGMGQSRKKTIIHSQSPHQPVQLVKVKVEGKFIDLSQMAYSLKTGATMTETFYADDDWLKGLVIYGKNQSEKNIIYIDLGLIFPETEVAGIPLGHNLQFGRYPEKPNVGSNDKVIKPGEEVEIHLTDDDHTHLYRFFKRHNFHQVDALRISSPRAFFNDDTMSFGDGIFKRDPLDPTRWTRVNQQ
jgi:hypothetical protein